MTTRQSAEVTVPRRELDRLWTPEHLERLARTYWRFLTRVSLGLLRVVYGDHTREIVLVMRPLTLLRFQAPDYETHPGGGSVTWRIDSGLLVAPRGRGRGYLRLSVERPLAPQSEEGETVTGRVTSEVASFYPALAGWGWFSHVGRHIYRFTQLQVHRIVTHAFLRSLARLDLARSRIGALAAGPPDAAPGSERPETPAD